MKRLLAYLFIVLGLGLVVNVSVNAEITLCKKNNFSLKDITTPVYLAEKNSCYTNSNKISIEEYVDILLDWNLKQKANIFWSKDLTTKLLKSIREEFIDNKLDTKYLDDQLVKKFSNVSGVFTWAVGSKIISSSSDDYMKGASNTFSADDVKSAIAKTEPSQTQEVSNQISYDWVAITKHPKRNKNFIATKLSTKKKAIDLAMMKCYKYVTNSLSKRGYNDCSLVNVYNEKNKNITQIAKQEPSQSLDDPFIKNFKQWSILHKYDGRYFWNDSVNLDLKQAIAESAVDCVNQIKRYSSNLRVFPKDCKLNTIQIVSIYNKKKIFRPKNRKELNKLIAKNLALLGEKTSTKIVKKEEPKQEEFKPKKKVEVAKVVEPKQEEFKPEDKDIDNDAPVIEIAEAITVVSQSYTIKGTVRDKSKPIYLEINGRPVEVKQGKFELDRFNIDPDVVEELKIVAIDQWNNRSEKIVKVTVELKDTQMVKFYEELKPNKVKVKTDKNKIAIIIGIEKYKNQFECIYCNRDAKAFKEYATRALGVKSSNIKLLVDSKATRPEIFKAFKLWLPRIAGEDKDIYIFFAGHGLASDDGNDLYILPQDGESSLLEDTAISRVELISLIQKINPKSVTMFFDTCYSGQTRDERMLVASLRPIRIVADEQDTPNNFTIFTASNYDQTSGSIEEAQQGMFSYYLMKGLEGKADENKDYKITNGELIAYLKINVSKEAFTQNREQDPMLSGDPDQVLMSYR